MTNRELILRTLEHLKPLKGYIDVSETLWKEFKVDESKKMELREILLTGELINLAEDNWKMKLTGRGIAVKPRDLDDEGYFINDYDKLVRRITLLGIIPIIYYALEILKTIYKGIHCFCMW